MNRLCGSGMQSIVNAAQMIQLGEAKTVLAGGMESMSQAPFVVRGARWGIGLGQGKLEDSLMQGLLDTQCGLYMAQTAEEYSSSGESRARRWTNSRCSLQRRARCAKRLPPREEITPVALKDRKGKPTGEMFEKDDHLRPQTTLEGLAKLPPAFGKDGMVTEETPAASSMVAQPSLSPPCRTQKSAASSRSDASSTGASPESIQNYGQRSRPCYPRCSQARRVQTRRHPSHRSE